MPGTFDPDPVKEELYGDRESDARHDLATTIPTTLVGLLAVLKICRGCRRWEVFILWKVGQRL